MKKYILLVGDYLTLWQEFVSRSHAADNTWIPRFARTGAEAIALSAECEFAAVVADFRLADMSGIFLLDELMRRQPRAVRIILSDLLDTEGTVKCVGRAHHHLLKPCDVPTILNALNSTTELEKWLPGAAVRSLVSQMRRVPNRPAVYSRIVEEMQSASASIEKVSELIAQDPAITAKVLQLANSAVFGLQLHVNQPVDAVAYVGLETIKSLVLLAHAFAALDDGEIECFSLEALWRHSVLTGHFARRIAVVENAGPEIVEQAFAAGLLHDLGKLLLGANLPETYARILGLAREERFPLPQMERRTLGACHAELGVYLLGMWGLPEPIVEAVALHHEPARAPGRGRSPLTFVHAANVIAHETHPEDKTLLAPEMDEAYLGELDVLRYVEEWRRHCRGLAAVA